MECNHCGAKNLHWEKNEEGKWRLYTPSDKKHTCILNQKKSKPVASPSPSKSDAPARKKPTGRIYILHEWKG